MNKIILLLILIITWNCQKNPTIQQLDIGGDISLTTKGNKNWQLSQNLKPINLIFFGYTSCPDYCPMTLAKYKKLNQLLGEEKNKVQYIFISLDTKKDTPDSVQNYVDFYVENGIGLIGSEEQIQKVIKEFKAFYQVNPDGSIDHSTYTFLVDKNGKTRYLFRHQQNPNEMLHIIQFLLKE